MIWICTVCLLAIAAWLIFNALNERRWVEAHSHDETVASDDGLFGGFTQRAGSGLLDIKGKVSIYEEDSRFARTVAKVQEKTSSLGEKYFESKAQAARIDDLENAPRSASEENSLFGRSVARVGEKLSKLDDKIVKKVQAPSNSDSDSATGLANAGDQESLLIRTSRKVAATSEGLGKSFSGRARNFAQGYKGRKAAADGDGFFDNMVDKVSSRMDKLESKVLTSAQSKTPKEDLVTRVASKVGKKMSELEGDKKD